MMGGGAPNEEVDMVHVSLATPDDLEIIIDLFHQIDLHYFGAGAPSTQATAGHVKRTIFQEHCGVDVALALEGEAPVGIATFSILYPAPNLTGQLFMKDLYVSRTARSAGVGKALLRFLAQYALEKGCSRFDWTAESTNPEAVHFYDHLGIPRVPEKIYYRLSGDALQAMAGGGPQAS